MINLKHWAAGLLLAGILGPAAALAHDYAKGDVEIGHPWSRPTPPGVSMGVGYLSIHNKGDAELVLVSAKTPAAASVSVHESTMHNGMMQMQPLKKALTIPAGETVELKPHGLHLMLEQLKAPLKEGESIPLTLTFDRAEPMDVQLNVVSLDDEMKM